MGTSSSYSGPSDKPALLPPWAFPPGDSNQPLSPDAPEDEASSEKQSEISSPPSILPLWRNAKTLMSNYTSSGDRGRLFSVGSRYVAAKGGARKAAASATSGKAVSSYFANFLTNISKSGVTAGLETLGLRAMIGQSAEKVLAAILNKIAPSGASLEEEAARMAANDVLGWLYETFISENGELTALEKMTEEDIRQAIFQSVSAYIYHRWLQELGLRIEKGAVSEVTAVNLERDVKVYVRERLLNEVQNREVMHIDWNSRDGKRIIDKLYNEAYRIIEAGE